MAVRRHPAVGPTGATGSTGATGATGATGPAGTAPAGVPVLRGPYVVDYTDIPHDGDTMTLWTPQVGDILLALGVDFHGAWINWDHGSLSVETPVDLDCLINASNAGGMAGLNTQFYIFPTTDPVQIRLHGTPGVDPTTGHLSLYALVARAVAP